jgi:hypothetical protein
MNQLHDFRGCVPFCLSVSNWIVDPIQHFVLEDILLAIKIGLMTLASAVCAPLRIACSASARFNATYCAIGELRDSQEAALR